MPVIPQILWGQTSSSNESMKNVIRLSIRAQDIAESTLTCKFTNKSIDFYTYAREGFEECEYNFKLNLYSDVIPAAVEKHLTEQGLTIILRKKQRDSKDWPRLTTELLPPEQLIREGDQRHKSIDARQDGDAQIDQLANHGLFFFRRSMRLGELSDVDNAIFCFEDVMRIMPGGSHADKAVQLNRLGASFSRRFFLLEEIEDIRKAISFQNEAFLIVPDKSKSYTSSSLGLSYLRYFKVTGNVQDVDLAISYHNNAHNYCLSADPPVSLSAILNDRGQSYFRRFEKFNEPQDLDQAFSDNNEAVNSAPSDDHRLPIWRDNLGSCYFRRFERDENPEDIGRAIELHQKAISKCNPSCYVNLPDFFNNLGNAHLSRYEKIENPQDLKQAIFNCDYAIKSAPPGSVTANTTYRHNLGVAYFRLFQRTNKLEDINHAIKLYQSAIKSSRPTNAELPSYSNDLGTALSNRFKRTGNLQDIEAAISHHQSALNGSGRVNLPGVYNNLGNSYIYRSQRNGDLQDIKLAIDHHEKAVESTPADHADFPRWSDCLGTSYLKCFVLTRSPDDLAKAISHYKKAVNSPRSARPSLPGMYNNLGTAYAYQFQSTRNLEDLNLAESYHQRALESTSSDSGHPDRLVWLYNFGKLYTMRFKYTRELQDIEKAINYQKEAIESTPSGHAIPSWRLQGLGDAYLEHFKHINHPPHARDYINSHRQDCIRLYRQAAEADGPPSVRLEAARRAAMMSQDRDEPEPDRYKDFALAIGLRSEVSGLEQTIHRRYVNLHRDSDLVRQAVFVALVLGRPSLALEWLEEGRCLVWNQLNQLRTPPEHLRASCPSDLADRFINVAALLESDGTRSPSSISATHPKLPEIIRRQDEIRNHTDRAAEYKQLLEEIRALQGFQDFLRPPKATDLLSSLPPDGPVIIFNLHEVCSDALVLKAGMEKPLHIRLTKFKLSQAKQLRTSFQSDLLRQRTSVEWNPNKISMSLVLKELWCNIVQPIFEALGYLSVPPNFSDRPRVWWCPTGPLAFLPLHAAGIYNPKSGDKGQCASDFVVSSYTPTVRSLNDKFKGSSTPSKSTGLMIISQPETPGLPPIPYAREEADALKELTDKTAIASLLLVESEATKEKVQAEMKSHRWAHFACHGEQNTVQPLDSGLHLYDGCLQLLEIMKQNIPNLDLAFLSACEMSEGDPKLPDEVSHFTGGMLAAGYRGVVGTMWSISDEYGPEFAMEFYQYLFENGLDSSRAAHALDHAVREVRKKLGEDEEALLKWVPYVHFGY